MAIRAVVFDFYFTLANPTVHAAATVAELLATHGADHSADEVLGVWFRGGRSIERPLDGEVPPFVAFREQWAAAGGELLRGFGLPADGEGWARSRRDAHSRAVIYDDVPVVLHELRARGLPVGVLPAALDSL